MFIPEDKILSVTNLIRNYKGARKKIEVDKINFIFSNNKPSAIIMTYNEYKELVERKHKDGD